MKVYLIIALVGLIGCDHNTEIEYESIDSYPVAIGNEWNYTSESILKIFESESSNTIIETDSLSFSIKIKIEKDTVLNDTMNVLKFTSLVNGNKFSSSQYSFLDSVGLQSYAYSNGGSHIYAKKSSGNYVMTAFPSPEIFVPVYNTEDIFVFEPRPRLNLKFPLKTHSKWTYVFPFEPLNLQIDKEVVGYESIRIGNQTYSCYKIKWIYLENKLFDGLTIFDWVSAEGLIKRNIIYPRSRLTLGDGESIGSAQQTEIITLVGLNLF